MIAAALPAAFAIAACSATAHASPTPSAARAARDTTPRYTEADVKFMQDMIGHHAQALTMTSMVPSRTKRQDIRLIAERIEATQREEIALMRRWLTERHKEAPSADAAQAHHDMSGHTMSGHDMSGHDALMPGMLTSQQLDQLSKAKGPEFDRLFLQYMIRHHEGALTMVADLFATPGAAQESEVFRMASDVDADQRAEIQRMRTMQGARTREVQRR
jgi:uncharacterized protein (DUF305 family)